MKEIVCRSCGVVNNYTTELRNNQKVATCNECGSFIKNIPYAVQKFYFGKYKGTPISECDDLSYLNWFVENTKPTPNLKKSCLERIETLKNLGL